MQVATPENMARRILVVDDEEVVREFIRKVLDLDHYEVELAAGSEEALTACKGSKFDLVIMDYEMPTMKGDKLAVAIKAMVPQQPILMVTAFGEALRLDGSFPLAVNGVISKPFDLEEFRQAVRQISQGTKR